MAVRVSKSKNMDGRGEKRRITRPEKIMGFS